MIKPFLSQNGYSFNDIIVWNGIISRLLVINDLIKEPDDVRFAKPEEIEKYLKHQI